MKLDDFLKPKKVRCINSDKHKDLTEGKIYDVVGATCGILVIYNDNGDKLWYDMNCFELVIDSAENPLQKMELTPDKNNEVRAGVSYICHATPENYERLQATFPHIEFEQPPTQEDIDNEAVDKLAQAMKNKLAKKREQGYKGWETCKHGDLVQLLINHVDKGDPIDVANFCAFLFARGESLTGGDAR